MNPIHKTAGHLGRTFVGLAVLAILAISGLVGHAAEGTAKVMEIRKGKAEFSIDGSTWSRLKVGAVLKPGSWVRTDRRATVDLFGKLNGPAIRLKPASTLLVKTLAFTDNDAVGVDITTHLVLTQGSVVGAVKRLTARSSYTVEVLPMDAAFRLHGGMYQISTSGRLVAGPHELTVDFLPSGDPGEPQTVVIPEGKVFALTGKAGTGRVVEPQSDEIVALDIHVYHPLTERPINVPTRGEGLGVDPAKVGFNGPFPKAPAK